MKIKTLERPEIYHLAGKDQNYVQTVSRKNVSILKNMIGSFRLSVDQKRNETENKPFNFYSQ